MHGICGLSLLHLKTEKNKENICKENDGRMKTHTTGTTVHVAIDGDYAGHIIISDEIKKLTKRILAYCEISSKIEVVSHDCLFFNNLGEEAV